MSVATTRSTVELRRNGKLNIARRLSGPRHHRFTVSGLGTRTGSATGDDRVGVWCEKIGPSREGDKRPASGLDINLACKCCPAGIERDGVGCISFRWRPLDQPGIVFSDREPQLGNPRPTRIVTGCRKQSCSIVFLHSRGIGCQRHASGNCLPDHQHVFRPGAKQIERDRATGVL